jgi:hypothetical protein
MGKDLLPGMAPRFHKKITFKNLSEGSQGWPLLSGNLEGMTRFVAIAFRKPCRNSKGFVAIAFRNLEAMAKDLLTLL